MSEKKLTTMQKIGLWAFGLVVFAALVLDTYAAVTFVLWKVCGR